jgi:hypothetical protein
MVPDTADDQSADRSGSLQLPLQFLKAGQRRPQPRSAGTPSRCGLGVPDLSEGGYLASAGEARLPADSRL